MYRPPRAHHCRICQRCIRKMDHHCPWINNCVGEWNQKYFIQFLFYVGILSLYSIALVAASWYFPCPECPKDIHVSLSKFLLEKEFLIVGKLNVFRLNKRGSCIRWYWCWRACCSACSWLPSGATSSRPSSPTRPWWSRPSGKGLTGRASQRWRCWPRCAAGVTPSRGCCPATARPGP